MQKDTRYFTVFGSAYVPEHHGFGFEIAPRARSRAPDFAPSWVVLCTLFAGISVFATELAIFTAGSLR